MKNFYHFLQRCRLRRVFILIFFLAYVPATSSASYANESKKISLQKEKITVQSVFKWLEKTTEYSILLKEDQKLLSHTVALNLKNVSIEEAVATILKNTSYTFKISGGYITVVPQKKRKARKNTLNTTARKKAAKKKVKRQIKGVVKDVDGTPLIGVTVAEKNTTNGVNTNIDGEFSINVSSTQATLVFSYVGYRNLEINIGNQTFLEIVMRPNIKELEEVVVVAYGQKKKATVTGSISSIKADKLAEISTPSLTNMLAGSISGLSAVSVSGRPGADDAELYIRGVSSLNSKDPLVLVDGVERSWSQLDPNEIADLTVLKDASSTAVFGVRGANGVILITTKRGKKGKPVMNFSSSFGLQAWREKKEYLRAKEWMDFVNEGKINDGAEPAFTKEWLAKYDDPDRDMAMYPDKDVWGLYTRDIAPQYQHNFNTSGGTENIRYFVSLGYLDQKGMFAGYDLIPELDYDYRYQRFNYRTNLDFDLTKTTTLQLNLGGRNKITSRPGGSKNDDSVWREIENGSPVSGGGIIDGRLYRKSKYAPDQSSEGFYNNGLRTKRQYELNIDLAVKQKLDYLLKGLSVNVKGSYNSSYDFYFTENELLEEYVPMFRKDMTWLPDDYPVKDPYKVLHVLYNDGAGKKSNTQEYGKGRNFYIEGALNYKQSFGDHTVGVLAMYNAKRTYYPKYFTDLPSGYVGLVGRMTYDYASKYLFDFSIGYNGSENFHKDRRFGTFPSFSLGYVISEEDFWNIDWIPYLKIRGSYGIVGSDKGRDKHARFKYLPGTYVWSGGYNFGDNTNNNWKPGANEGAVSNTLLTWETARKKNIGLDAKFFEGQLEFNFDYFTENRTDILIERNTIPSYVAFTPPTINSGEVENSGYEISLNYRKSKGDFRFNAGFNVGFNKNKVIYKDELPLHDAPWAMRTGKAVGQIFGYEFLGFYEEGKLNNNNVDAKEVQPTIQPGDCIYADLNNDGKIDKKDEKSIGHTEYPGITGGINFGIEYKRFSLTSNWAGASKVSRILQGALRRAGGWGHASAILKYSYENRWTPETAATATRPRSSTASQVENTKNSSLWVVDGSYLALKNIQVIYNIPAEPFAKFGITNASISLSANNLYTFRKCDLIDPEVRKTANTYPSLRTYLIKLNVSF